jgi:hypothetical protein
MSRKVFINVEPEQLARAIDTIGYTNAKKYEEAIGYLSMWNLNFPSCTISTDGATDLFAVYFDESDPDRRYVIGAVWHGDHYGFHS